MNPSRVIVKGVLLLAFLCVPPVRADLLSEAGVDVFRAVTTNLDGSGIIVAQPEASDGTNYEVNPSYVSQPAGLFVYTSAIGTDTNYPNSVGTESGHADDVGKNFYGGTSGVATNVARVENYDAGYFINFFVVSNLAPLDVALVNQSFTYGILDTNDQEAVDSAFDDYAAMTGILFVSAACNADISTYVCAPGTAYNCISVGSYHGNTSIGPTPENGRSKPDITAYFFGGGTSFSTPIVSGVAAVLKQAAMRGDGGNTNAADDNRVIKAVLLNGAVKPSDWTNGPGIPLDARYGAGVVNLLNAYELLAGGQGGWNFSTNVPQGTAHPPVAITNTVPVLSGWDLNTNTSSAGSDAVNHYLFTVTNGSGGGPFTAKITLTWWRQPGQTAINDLDLFLYDATSGNLVACSTSRVDNVEHIYVPQLPASRYDLEVVKYGGAGAVSTNETYGLAWSFASPRAQLVNSGTNAWLQWPLYPAGYLVEASTNLLPGSWSTNGLPGPAITNGLKRIPVGTTNAAQFFRLRSPDL